MSNNKFNSDRHHSLIRQIQEMKEMKLLEEAYLGAADSIPSSPWSGSRSRSSSCLSSLSPVPTPVRERSYPPLRHHPPPPPSIPAIPRTIDWQNLFEGNSDDCRPICLQYNFSFSHRCGKERGGSCPRRHICVACSSPYCKAKSHKISYHSKEWFQCLPQGGRQFSGMYQDDSIRGLSRYYLPIEVWPLYEAAFGRKHRN